MQIVLYIFVSLPTKFEFEHHLSINSVYQTNFMRTVLKLSFVRTYPTVKLNNDGPKKMEKKYDHYFSPLARLIYLTWWLIFNDPYI